MHIEKAKSDRSDNNNNNNNNAKQLPEDVSVLVVDGDSTSLTIVSDMLSKFGYKVMTANKAVDALRIASEKEDDLDLVLTEVRLPDMNKYELLEKMTQVSKLPIVIMSDDDDGNAMLGGLFKGAVYYIDKPVTMDNLQHLWQFGFMKNKQVMDNHEEEISSTLSYFIMQENILTNHEEMDNQLLSDDHEEKQNNHKKFKRKINVGEMDEEDRVEDSSFGKKPKLTWTNELHNRFLQAIRVLGLEKAHPKKILDYMNVPGLRKENISSHLQKYRLSLKKEQNAIEKTKMRESAKSGFASVNGSSSFSNIEGGAYDHHQFPEQNSTSIKHHQPQLKTNFQNTPNTHDMLSVPPNASIVMQEQPTDLLTKSQPLSEEDLFLSRKFSFNDLIGSEFGGTTDWPYLMMNNSIDQQQEVEQVLLLPQSPQLDQLPLPTKGPEEHDNDIMGMLEAELNDELIDIPKGTSTSVFRVEDLDGLW